MVEETNDKIEGDLPMKKLDPECFSIHYLIYKIFFIHESLCDLGPIINLIPLYLARKLKGVMLSPSTTTITLVDGSCKQSSRRINNVLLRVGKLCFFVCLWILMFWLLNMEEEDEYPLILRRPLLATSRAKSDTE